MINRRHLATKFGLFFALLLSSTQFVHSQKSQSTLVKGGWVFRTKSLTFEKNTGIVIRDGLFKQIGVKGHLKKTDSTLELGKDDYILPGLIDLHAHYNVKLLRKRREEFHVVPIVYLANGVTVTFSAGEYDPEGMWLLRRRIEAGEQIGPRLLTSGPYYGRVRRGWRNHRTKEAIERDVDLWVQRGAGGFKAKGIDPDSLRILIHRAHMHGKTVTGHLDSGYRNSVNPRDAINMGIDRIEHFLGGDAMPATRPAYSSLGKITSEMPEFKKIVALYIKKGIYFDATITAYGYFGKRGEEYDYWVDERKFFTPYIQKIVQERGRGRIMQKFEDIYQAKQKTIYAFWKAGGKMTMGTDHFSNGEFLPGFGAHRELDAFVRAGIPAAEAIKIGTLNGAKAMKIDDKHGSIEIGKSADLFVVKGNPLKNIRNTRNVKYVMRAGKLYDSKKLLKSVKGKLGPRNKAQEKDW